MNNERAILDETEHDFFIKKNSGGPLAATEIYAS